MDENAAFYEEARDLGEVTRDGFRYRLYYDGEHQLTIAVLVPGQQRVLDAGTRS